VSTEFAANDTENGNLALSRETHGSSGDRVAGAKVVIRIRRAPALRDNSGLVIDDDVSDDSDVMLAMPWVCSSASTGARGVPAPDPTLDRTGEVFRIVPGQWEIFAHGVLHGEPAPKGGRGG